MLVVKYVAELSIFKSKSHNKNMSSVTGDFTNLTTEERINSLNSRNAATCVKRPCLRRKFLKITPIHLRELQQELEETENEPPSWLTSKEPEEKDDTFEMSLPKASQTPLKLSPMKNSVVPLQTPVNKSPIKNGAVPLKTTLNLSPIKNGAVPLQTPVNRLLIKNSAVPLQTPAKQSLIKIGDFVSPRVAAPQKTNRMLEYDYITPNKVPPKIQCSVNMQTYLKTPIDNLSNNGKRDSNIQQSRFKEIRVNQEEYIVLNQLGKGGSSEVFHCYSLEKKAHRAIKCVSLQNAASANGFINEVRMLKRLQSCNRIIQMFDFEIIEEAKTLLVVLEVGGSDLSKILKESALNSSHMPVYMLLYYWMEMLYAVKQIHTHGIIHSDLKPANFLKVEGYLKLIDFGIASCIQNDMTSVIKGVPEGSFNYISPEALNNESSSNMNSPSFGKPKYKISFKSDVWSLGCILYQLIYRKTPFQHITNMWAKMYMLLDPNHKIDYPNLDWVPPRIINTVKMCLQHDTKLRPSVDELILEYETVFQSLL